MYNMNILYTHTHTHTHAHTHTHKHIYTYISMGRVSLYFSYKPQNRLIF